MTTEITKNLIDLSVEKAASDERVFGKAMSQISAMNNFGESISEWRAFADDDMSGLVDHIRDVLHKSLDEQLDVLLKTALTKLFADMEQSFQQRLVNLIRGEQDIQSLFNNPPMEKLFSRVFGETAPAGARTPPFNALKDAAKTWRDR